MEYESVEDPDARLHDQRPQLETGRMAPAQHGCSQRDETGAARPLSLTWDPDSHKGSGLFLFPPPFICVLSCMTLSLRIHVKRLW